MKKINRFLWAGGISLCAILSVKASFDDLDMPDFNVSKLAATLISLEKECEKYYEQYGYDSFMSAHLQRARGNLNMLHLILAAHPRIENICRTNADVSFRAFFTESFSDVKALQKKIAEAHEQFDAQ